MLAEHGLSRADLQRALAELERTEGTRIRSIVGINDDGVFGTTVEGWRPDLPDACNEPFVPLLWLKILELLGRVPEGSTARFLQDGTLPRLISSAHRAYAAAASRRRRSLRSCGRRLRVWRPRPVNSCQRWTITSQYSGSSSTSRACRPVFSPAIRVEPEPPNRSSTMSRLLLELRIARSTSATGFMVGCRSFLAGLSKNQTSPWSRAPHQ